MDQVVLSEEYFETLCTHLSLPLDYGLREGKTSSLWSLYFQSLLSYLAHGMVQQMFTGQRETKKLDPRWNLLLYRLVVLTFLDALVFGWADAASASFFYIHRWSRVFTHRQWITARRGLLGARQLGFPVGYQPGPADWSFLQGLHICFSFQDEPHLTSDVCVHVVRGGGGLLVYQDVICLHTPLGSSCTCHFQFKLFSMKSLLPPHSQVRPLILGNVIFYPFLLVVCFFCCVWSNLKAELCLVHTSLL